MYTWCKYQLINPVYTFMFVNNLVIFSPLSMYHLYQNIISSQPNKTEKFTCHNMILEHVLDPVLSPMSCS